KQGIQCLEGITQMLGCGITYSDLSPVEFKYLLNPERPEFYGIVQKAQQIPFRFDSRLKPDRK
ncbi:TPA: hypothetical protein MIQ27_07760, partial [Klebsiella pneumoniae]|nr:hypothetical protein [Klebsiella pneumoniae]HBY1464077.1 hypothetical protein [Klebsiella pneumoniae]